MNLSDKDALDRNKKTQAFDPPLNHEEETEDSSTGDEEKQSAEEWVSPEVEENKEPRKRPRWSPKRRCSECPAGNFKIQVPVSR
jgi:hypothetical protein